ncbi:MAG: hypothetical protein KAT15_31580 [Bacteroidales bacterium]|nr:hypothetical protein [Bacteroidales bacterium]
MKPSRSIIPILLFFLLIPPAILAQQTDYRPDLFFREDWKEIPAENPVTQRHVNNPDLILALYGPGKDSIKKSHHDSPADDPYYIWSGLCLGNWALTLKHKDSFVDLSKFANIRWRTKQYGFRQLHILLKLADGTWLVSKQGDPVSSDWRIREFILDDLSWYSIDMETITEMKPAEEPDLSQVDEIGFTDLMPGGKSDACSRLDWLEVYGYLVPRN